MKKICFVMPQMYPLLSGFKDNKIIGGSEMQVDRIADTLDKKKYEICFIVNEKGDDEILNGKKIVKFSGNNHISIYLSFIKAFIRADADTYYQRIGGMITGFCGILSKICKKKFIHAVAWDRQCEKNNFSLLRHISYNIGIKSADVVISQSEYQKELLKKNFNRKSIVIKSIYVIKTKEKPQKKNFILWGSTIDKTKQPDLFLRLAEQLPEYKFIMFGGKRMNEESTYSKIKQKAKKIKNLEFKGFLDKEDAFELIEKATVFVNTSELNREGFPNTFLESGDCFTPVVSLNSNPDNVLTKYNSGFHSNSFEQTIDDIKTLMKDEKLRDEMGLNNHNYVLKYHDANNIIKELEAVF